MKKEEFNDERDQIGLKGNHHDFCLYAYKLAKNTNSSWKCFCDLARSYDAARVAASVPTVVEIKEVTYPFLAGIAGGLTFMSGWSEEKQGLLEKENSNLAQAIHDLLTKERKYGN